MIYLFHLQASIFTFLTSNIIINYNNDPINIINIFITFSCLHKYYVLALYIMNLCCYSDNRESLKATGGLVDEITSNHGPAGDLLPEELLLALKLKEFVTDTVTSTSVGNYKRKYYTITPYY